MSPAPREHKPAGNAGFQTTNWSIILAAGQRPTSDSREALEVLCKTYWYPLYAYVRRRGHGVEEAEDLTQGFFARLLEKNYLKEVRRERGKFRSFLLASLKHYLANEWDRAQAKKRGGGQTPFSLDREVAEERYRLEPRSDLTPENVYERQWAVTILEETLARIREEFIRAGKAKHFGLLEPFLTGEDEAGSYRQVAAELGTSEGAVKVTVHRLRRRFGQVLRIEIAKTVASPDQIDEEIEHLFATIRP